TIQFTVCAGRGNVGAEIASANIVRLSDDRFAGGKLDRHFATLALIHRRVALQINYALQLAIVYIVAIVGTDPERQEMKFDLPAGQLQHLKTVGCFRTAQAVMAGDLEGLRSARLRR